MRGVMERGTRASGRFDAVVFDLDGTLIDSLRDLADSANAALARFGHPEHPLESYRIFVGEGARRLMERALPEGRRDDGTIDALVEAMLEEYSLRREATTVPYPGIAELLDAMRERGLALAILSNKPHEPTLEIARGLLGRWSFAAVRGSRPELPRKPDPTVALAIAAELGVATSRCLYLGDTAIDMRTATAAGMYPVGVLWGFRGAEELREGGARRLVAHPSELLELL
jgi:phosphoglycolate phosphatase